VYFDGEYHLFYQYYPDNTVWGPMHWGHAVSTDLVFWEHLPIALYPDSLGYIFSGSAVVDWNNTTGFQAGNAPPLVAVFTQHDPEGERAGRIDYQTQGIAYSHDRGRSWTMYEGNPVLPNPGLRDFRDPKVRRHDASNQWIMVLAAGDRVRFYGSSDLKNWRHLSDFGAEAGNHEGVWECPDLFPLATASGETRWVLLVSINPGAPNGGSGTQYFVGRFDGTAFTSDNPPETELWLDWGRDNYAGVTWSDVPEEDGRSLFIGWMSNWAYAQVVPTERWRSAMTLPRSLTLVETDTGLRVASNPVEELQRLRGKRIAVGSVTVVDGRTEVDGVADRSTFEAILDIDLDGSKAEVFGIELANANGATYRFGYDRATGSLFSDRTQAGHPDFSDAFATKPHAAPYRPSGNRMQLHVFVDKSSIEVFVDGGQLAMTELFFPAAPFNRTRLFSEGGSTKMAEAVFYPLDSIWN
jgi:fructan beta-fructosidase